MKGLVDPLMEAVAKQLGLDLDRLLKRPGRTSKPGRGLLRKPPAGTGPQRAPGSDGSEAKNPVKKPLQQITEATDDARSAMTQLLDFLLK
jgi:hypothetical protein